MLDFWDKRFITDRMKEWSITFNKPLTKAVLENYRIFVEKWGESKQDHPVQIILDKENKKIVKVKPLEPYETGSTYLLYMENIKNGKIIILPFEVKDQLDTVRSWIVKVGEYRIMNKTTWFIVTFLAILVAGYAIVQYFIIGVDQAGLVQMKLMLSELNVFWYIMLFIHVAY